MKVSTSNIKKLLIEDVLSSHKLDPVTVILEDIEPRKGKIIIECYGQSWSAYWGGMGDSSIAEFFCSCDKHYIAGNLSSLRSQITDYNAVSDMIKKNVREQIAELLHERRGSFIGYDEARRKYDDLADAYNDVPTICDRHDLENNSVLMSSIYGNEWRYELTLPQKPNPDYQYLCRIITTVQEALRETELASAA